MVFAWLLELAVWTAAISPVTSPPAMLKTAGVVLSSNASIASATRRRGTDAAFPGRGLREETERLNHRGWENMKRLHVESGSGFIGRRWSRRPGAAGGRWAASR